MPAAATATSAPPAGSAPAAEAPERLFGADDARAYRRFLAWSVGQGFAMAVVEVTAPRDRDALVAWTKAAAPGARVAELDQPGRRPVRVILDEACPSPAEASVLLLTGLEQAPERERLRAELNVHRTSLVEAFPLPWVLFLHPAAARELELRAPDFADFANVWVREEKPGLTSRSHDRVVAPTLRDGAAIQGASEPGGTDLLERADHAITQGFVDKAADLLATYDLRHPAGRREDLWRIRLEGRLSWLGGKPDDARVAFDTALRLCAREAPERALLLGDLARLREDQGDWEEAISLHQEALHILGNASAEPAYATTLLDLARIRQARGDIDAARTLYREALAIYEARGDRRSRAVVLTSLARIHAYHDGDVSAARALQEEALKVFEELGDRRARGAVLAHLADIHSASGDPEAALALYAEALEIDEAVGDQRSRAAVLGAVAAIHADRGALDEALRLHAEQLRICQGIGDVYGAATAQWSLGRIALERGDFRDAREQMSAAHATARKLGALNGVSLVGLDLGRLFLALGDEAGAAPLLERSRDGFQRLGWPVQAQEAQRLLDTLASAPAA
jgi:tetratricopeptide (TPR) repeat protein